MTGRRVVAVVVIAVLAGCGGFSADGGAGTAAPTLTPAPVPVDGVADLDGISRNAVDAEAVLARHRQRLANVSYAATETFRVGPAGNASYRQRTRLSAAAGDGPVAIEEEIAADGSYVGRGTDLWWNGERAVYRYAVESGRETYYYADERPAEPLRVRKRLRGVLETVTVARVDESGDGIVVAGYLENESVVPRTRYLTDVDDASVSLRVRESGLVDRVAIEYDARHQDRGRQRVRYSYRVTDVGATRVTPPQWLDEVPDDD